MVTPNIKLASGKIVKLGRICPKLVKNIGRCRVVVNADDSVSVVPRLEAYVGDDDLKEAAPDEVDWLTKAATSISRVYANDRLGDCVIAGKYHQMGIWSANDTPSTILATDQEVIDHYHRICGAGDNGCMITSVLDYFQRQGLVAGGKLHKIDSYVSINNTNKELVKAANYLFGGLTLGINLPQAWTQAPGVWDVTSSRIVGGHDVCSGGHNAQGVQIATWGEICTITWAAFLSTRWVEECYAELSPDWYNDDRLSPHGINVELLKHDLAMLEEGAVPPMPTPPGPIPPVPPTPPAPVPPSPTPGPTPFIIFLKMLVRELLAIPNLPPYLQKVLAWALMILDLFGIKREEIGC